MNKAKNFYQNICHLVAVCLQSHTTLVCCKKYGERRLQLSYSINKTSRGEGFCFEKELFPLKFTHPTAHLRIKESKYHETQHKVLYPEH